MIINFAYFPKSLQCLLTAGGGVGIKQNVESRTKK